MESRTGRTKQRKPSIRKIFQARVLPKGGWESDGACMEAAGRKAQEVAGILYNLNHNLGQIGEARTPKQISKDVPKSLYQFY